MRTEGPGLNASGGMMLAGRRSPRNSSANKPEDTSDRSPPLSGFSTMASSYCLIFLSFSLGREKKKYKRERVIADRLRT